MPVCFHNLGVVIMKLKRRLVVFVLFLSSLEGASASGVLPALGTRPLAIGGMVCDKYKNPVGNALIAVKIPFHESALTCTSSDKNGNFMFHLPAGTYMLTASTPGLTGGILPFRDYQKETRDLVLIVGDGDGFTINGKVKAPAGKISSDSYVIVNMLRSIDSTIFYAPLDVKGNFKVTVPTTPNGVAYRIDLDSPLLKAVPVMIQDTTSPGVSRDCILETVMPIPAPEQVVSWIKENAVVIRAHTAGQGFSDLSPVKKIIGNARVVAMGETTHGSREFFQMKHRFLEFLVEEMGFTVLALEGVEAQEYAINDYVLGKNGDLANALAGLPGVYQNPGRWHGV